MKYGLLLLFVSFSIAASAQTNKKNNPNWKELVYGSWSLDSSFAKDRESNEWARTDDGTPDTLQFLKTGNVLLNISENERAVFTYDLSESAEHKYLLMGYGHQTVFEVIRINENEMECRSQEILYSRVRISLLHFSRIKENIPLQFPNLSGRYMLSNKETGWTIYPPQSAIQGEEQEDLILNADGSFYSKLSHQALRGKWQVDSAQSLLT